MSDKPDWEPINENNHSETSRLRVEGGYLYKHRRFFKASIDSHDREWVQDFHMVFVPDAQESVPYKQKRPFPLSAQHVMDDFNQDQAKWQRLYDSIFSEIKRLFADDLINKVGELSMKVNMMQSNWREFEKQEVEPLKRRVDMCENSDIQECKMVRKFINDLNERIESLEGVSSERAHIINYKSYLALQERIEKLESLALRHLPLPAGGWKKASIEEMQKVTAEHLQNQTECNHEWDVSYVLTSLPARYKCKKCGVFSDPIKCGDSITMSVTNLANKKATE